jgi:glyoxylase I family protein
VSATKRPDLNGVHHVALICSDYTKSKQFYAQLLGLEVVDENYREARDSWKLDLRAPDGTQLELFSFPAAPIRPSGPEAQGLRHLCFGVDDLEGWISYLEASDIVVEPVRVDPYTGKRFTFFKDPDNLPLELYQT